MTQVGFLIGLVAVAAGLIAGFIGFSLSVLLTPAPWFDLAVVVLLIGVVAVLLAILARLGKTQ
jgi:hypothetical protein